MKLSKNKNFILRLVLSALFGLSIMTFAFSLMPVSAGSKMVMKDGASIRIEAPAGIRFSAYVPEQYFENGLLKDGVEVGMLLVQENRVDLGVSEGDDNFINLDWDNGSYDKGLTLTANNPFIKKISSNDSNFVWANEIDNDVDGMVRFNAVVRNIPENGYGQTIVARAYITENGQSSYSDLIVKRSISQVANSLIAKALIEDADYEQSIENYVVATTPLADVQLTISESIASWQAVDGAQGYYVKFGGEQAVYTTQIQYDIGQSDYVSVIAVGDSKTTTRSNVATLTRLEQAAKAISYQESGELSLVGGTPPSTYFLLPESGEPYKKAGFNEFVIVITESSTAEGVLASLQRCEEAGMKATIQLHGGLVKTMGAYDSVQDLGANDPGNVFISLLDNVDFHDTPVRMFMIDEPSFSQLSYIEKVYIPWFNQNYGGEDSEYYFMVNLFGGYSTGIALRLDDPVTGQQVTYDTEEGQNRIYEIYQEKYISMINAQNTNVKIYSQDSYPFKNLEKDESGNIIENTIDSYVGDAWLFRGYRGAQAAADNGFEYQTYIQAFSSEHFNCRMPETIAEIKWQAYIYLALGSRHLEYFSYETRVGGVQDIYGMTNVVDGKVVYLPAYYHVLETNAELKKFQNVLLAYDNWIGLKSFVGTGNQKCQAFTRIADMELDSLTGVSSVVSDQDLVIGEMTDARGNHGYMMVGYDDPIFNRTTNVSVKFDGADGFIVYRNGERTLVKADANGTYQASLVAGEGAFVIPVYVD